MNTDKDSKVDSLDEILQENGPAEDLTVELGHYAQCFVLYLNFVLDTHVSLFSKEERQLCQDLLKATPLQQLLLYRMILRKNDWIKVSSLHNLVNRYGFKDIDELLACVKECIAKSWIFPLHGINIGHNINSSFEDGWEALMQCGNLDEIKGLCKKVTQAKAISKEDGLCRLFKHCTSQRTLQGTMFSTQFVSVLEKYMQASVSGNPSPGLAAGETGIPTSSSSSPRSMPVLVQCAVHVRTLVRRAQRFMTVFSLSQQWSGGGYSCSISSPVVTARQPLLVLFNKIIYPVYTIKSSTWLCRFGGPIHSAQSDCSEEVPMSRIFFHLWEAANEVSSCYDQAKQLDQLCEGESISTLVLLKFHQLDGSLRRAIKLFDDLCRRDDSLSWGKLGVVDWYEQLRTFSLLSHNPSSSGVMAVAPCAVALSSRSVVGWMAVWCLASFDANKPSCSNPTILSDCFDSLNAGNILCNIVHEEAMSLSKDHKARYGTSEPQDNEGVFAKKQCDGSVRDYILCVRYLQLLIHYRCYTSHRCGRWFDRISLICEKHLRLVALAYTYIFDGLMDHVNVIGGDRVALTRRYHAFCKKWNVASSDNTSMMIPCTSDADGDVDLSCDDARLELQHLVESVPTPVLAPTAAASPRSCVQSIPNQVFQLCFDRYAISKTATTSNSSSVSVVSKSTVGYWVCASCTFNNNNALPCARCAMCGFAPIVPVSKPTSSTQYMVDLTESDDEGGDEVVVVDMSVDDVSVSVDVTPVPTPALLLVPAVDTSAYVAALHARHAPLAPHLACGTSNTQYQPPTIYMVSKRFEHKDRKGKSKFIGWNDEFCSVEELVLQLCHHPQYEVNEWNASAASSSDAAEPNTNTISTGSKDENGSKRRKKTSDRSSQLKARALYSYEKLLCDLGGGGWTGWHCEGAPLLTLYVLLCWDVIFGSTQESSGEEGASVADVFMTPYQASPLDLCFASFFSRRVHSIERIIRELRQSSAADLRNRIGESYRAHYQMQCVGANWSFPLAMLQAIGVCIGGVGLSNICRAFMVDYHYFASGMPDLLMIRVLHRNHGCIDVRGWLGESWSTRPSSTSSFTPYKWSKSKIDVDYCSVEGVGVAHTNSLTKNTPSKEGKGTSDEETPVAEGREEVEVVDQTPPGDTGSIGSGNNRSDAISTDSRGEDLLLPPLSIGIGHEAEVETDAITPLDGWLDGQDWQYECMMVEVKGPSDHLSDKQRLWIQLMENSSLIPPTIGGGANTANSAVDQLNGQKQFKVYVCKIAENYKRMCHEFES